MAQNFPVTRPSFTPRDAAAANAVRLGFALDWSEVDDAQAVLDCAEAARKAEIAALNRTLKTLAERSGLEVTYVSFTAMEPTEIRGLPLSSEDAIAALRYRLSADYTPPVERPLTSDEALARLRKLLG